MSRSLVPAVVLAVTACTAPGLDHVTTDPTLPPTSESSTSEGSAASDAAATSGGTDDSETGSGSGSASASGSTSTSTSSTGSTGSTGTSDGSTTATSSDAGICGDAIVDAPAEECDDGNADPDDGCASCFRDRWVFATSMLLSPELIGGLAGADNLCGQLANQAGLGANWKGYRAWLSDSHESAGDRIFPGMGRYRRLDGVVVADNFEQFLSGTLSATFDVDEFGLPAPGGAWTGTRPDGTAAVGVTHCEDWSINTYTQIQGHYGSSGVVDGSWTYHPDPEVNPTGCDANLRLYCIEGE